MKPTYHIAVRSMVEHVLRSGDLRLDFCGSVRAVEGIRAHQQVQKARPDDYQAEVVVDYLVVCEKFQLQVSGRIDGIFKRGPRVVVEEIKTTNRSLKEVVAADHPIHWGQALCYAYMWARQEGLVEVDVQLTYVQLPGGRTREIVRRFEMAELERFFLDVRDRYALWVMTLAHWGELRDESIAKLPFPYPVYRTGQRAMAVEVYRAMRDGDHLLVQAATGIGKTMAALYPAVKALGEGLIPKVIFLTARTTGRLAAENALQSLRTKGLRLKSVTLTAKEKICFNPDNACLPEECAFARGHYDRINEALKYAFETDALTRATIESAAKQFQVCPFEFSLELLQWADCVICDYNYAFDPSVTLRRLFVEEGRRQAVLVDEAHNLADRAREMFSARLTKEPVMALRRQLKSELPKLFTLLGQINTWMVTTRRRCRQAGGECVERHVPETLIQHLQTFMRAAEKWLMQNRQTAFRADLLRFYFDCGRFLRVAENYDQRFATLFTVVDAELQIKLFCVDPSHGLGEVWQRCHAAVLFSATLTPADYFQTILGCQTQARKLNLPSPFPKENLTVVINTRISTLYRQRRQSCPAVSRAVGNLVVRHPGHYLLFFPSYEYLEMVYRQFSQTYSTTPTMVQIPDMDESQKEAFLHGFEHGGRDPLVGFAVMGGVFGEGIDLQGERLSGAIIVGVGLPGICTERELIREYHDRLDKRGFEFAYQFPGINRVLQAAGRVIRSEEDRGVVFLIDHRYDQPRYRRLLPAHWALRRHDRDVDLPANWTHITKSA